MICPKCQGVMHTVDRRGVHIEQCENCRGIFLDRGELEQITSAENSYYGAAASPAYREEYPTRGRYRDSPPPYAAHGGHDPRYRDSPPPYGGSGQHPRKRRGFLDELFG